MNLGRYEVIRELGKGAMGIVYLAKDPLIGRLVALKTIRVASGIDDEESREFQQRFVREAQAAGILSHPAIVTVHDIGQDAETGTSFIAMEYVEGKNLKEVLNQSRRLTHAEVAEIVAQVAEALDYAHSKGIIHRDVKPANIILCDNGRAKIMDFGIAKIASGAVNLTTTGQFLGTPNYMAPEQIKGTNIDGRTDLFSLGVVLYEGLGRRKPFGGDSLTSISYKIVHEQFVPLRDIDSEIPDAYDLIVARCLQKKPEARYQRGHELAEDLQKAARGELRAGPVEEPVSQDDTVMTHGPAEKTPTMELPFPEAGEAPAGASSTGAGAVAARPKPRPSGGMVPLVFKKKLPVPLFLGAILFLLVSVGAVSAYLWSQREEIPAVDTEREELVAKQRQLRLEGGELLQAGNIEAAYQKFSDLKELAPSSAEVDKVLRSLESIRLARMSYQQRLDMAKEKMAEARVLYDQGQYEEAMPLFQEAYHLDPTSVEAANFMKMTEEQLKLLQLRSGTPAVADRTRRTEPRVETSSTETAAPSQIAQSSVSVTLLTTFNSTITDGYILVKADGQTIVHENVWEERRGIFRRKHPKPVSIYSQVPSNTSAIDVWVVVPSLNLQEHRTVQPRLQLESINRLTISLDPDSKRVSVNVS